ncbi:conjugal transfer pilus assembly protein TraE [Klebsiella pneumoniae]|nr:conjugal transfer pilus assembly protein TraE [Klebsiella pneumoniae]
MFARKKSAQIREILISESAWEEMTCLFAPSLKVQLAEDAKRIKDNNVNATFYMTSIRAWPAENRVDIRGELKTWIGDSKPYSEIKSYVIQFSRVDGVSWLARFGEINNEKN